jgi:hypothetical protein
MTEHSTSEDRSHTGEWKTKVKKSADDAVDEANSLGLSPGAVVFNTLAEPGQEDGKVRMYYFE